MGVGEAPDWVADYETREMLWTKYGLALPMDFDELVLAIRWHNAKTERFNLDHKPPPPPNPPGS